MQLNTMSLYGDLPQAKNSTNDAGGAGTGWSALDSKLMPPPSLKKPAVPAYKPPPSVLRAAAAAGTGSVSGRGGPARCAHGGETKKWAGRAQ